MKSMLTTMVFLAMNLALLAQLPQSMKYQAVVRDNSGTILGSQNVSFRFSIHDLIPAGAVIYQETFNLLTDGYGIANMNIGTGTPVIGTFASINWGVGEKFLEVELDPAGGSTYVSMGTSQLVSVPYALHASHTENDKSNTLDDAYDEGGYGAGRSITADAGAIEITVPNGTSSNAIIATNNETFDASSTINAETFGPGHAVEAVTHHTTNPKATIYAQTLGTSSAVEGIISNTANSAAAIYGHTNGNGEAIFGYKADPSCFQAAVLGWTEGPGEGVKGHSAHPDGVCVEGSSMWAIGIYGASTYQNAIEGHSQFGIGVQGISDDSTGVEGLSNSLDPVDAGVLAGGKGAFAPGDLGAAALEINNGAIRVSGDNRPAGSFLVTEGWFPTSGCPGGDPVHTHPTGMSVLVLLENDLIVDDNGGSLIFLTAESPGYFDVFAQVMYVQDGVAGINVVAMGCAMGVVGLVKINYLIINPAAEVTQK